jgi:hypothetical protein
MVIISEKGNAKTPTTHTNETQLIDNSGQPNPKLGTTIYSAMSYLSQGNQLYTIRALHADAKHSAVLVKSKVKRVPTLGELQAPSIAWDPSMELQST